MRATLRAVLAALALPWVALAQGLDTTAPPDAPWSGELGAPALAGAPAPGLASALRVGLGEAPLVRYRFEGDHVDTDVIVGPGVTADLAVLVGWRRRVGVSLDLPVRVTTFGAAHHDGPVFGDLVVASPVALATGPVFVVATPRLTLPTGDPSRHAGSGVVGAAGSVAAAGQIGPIGVGGHVGGSWDAAAPRLDLGGGPRLDAGLRVAWVTPHVMVGLGSDVGVPTSAADREARGVASEVRLEAAGTLPAGWSWSASVGQAFTAAVGVPARVFRVGFTWRLGERSDPAPALTPPASRTLYVRSADGRPVRDAVVVAATGEIAHTDADGALVVARARGRDSWVARAPGLVDTEVPEPADPWVVTLPFAPTPLRVRVSDPNGNPVDATATLTGPGAPPAWSAASDGFEAALAPGRWTLRVAAPGHGAQERMLDVVARRVDPLLVEVILWSDRGDARLDLTVTDPTGRAVEGARLFIDGMPAGTTASGGTVHLEALPSGKATLSVASHRFAAGDTEVELRGGSDLAVYVPLAWRPGTVRIVARGPDGGVTDGLLQLHGPTALAPLPLGPQGERTVVLSPGTWSVLVSSASLGMQERVVEVTADRTDVQIVEVVLQPASPVGTADLVVQVRDRSGRPLDGVEVEIDGRAYGRTASAGHARIVGLPAGSHTVRLHGDGLRGMAARTVVLDPGPGSFDAVLDWNPGTLRVTARDLEAGPVDALVRLAGPGAIPGGSLGTSGARTFSGLAPGGWELLASAPAHGMQSRYVDVPVDGRDRVEAEFVLGAQGAGGNLRIGIRDPDGHPVSGARISLDGRPLGTTVGGDLTVLGVDPGRRRVTATAPGLAPAEAVAVVGARGEATVTLRPAWAPGTVRVTVTANGVPVPDAMVSAAGSTWLPARGVDDRGQGILALSPGSWAVLVSSATEGLTETVLDLGAAGPWPAPLSVDLREGSGAPATLFRVRTRRGLVVPDARIVAGETELGRAGPGGDLLVRGLPPGVLPIRVEAPGCDAVDRAVTVGEDGVVLVEVEPRPVPVQVWVMDHHRAPAFATVRAQGAEPTAPLQVDGSAELLLAPGRWTLGALGESGATDRVDVEVRIGSRPSVELVLGESVVRRAGLALEIDRVHFDPDQDSPRPEGDPVLRAVAELLIVSPEIALLEVQGHTDATGSVAHNVDLSARRAVTVREALVALGVAPERVVARGYGPTHPIGDNATPAGRLANRRVAFEILEVAGSPTLSDGWGDP